MSHYSDSDSDSPEDGTFDDWTEDEQPAQCLFSAHVCPSARLALEHDRDHHNVDIALVAHTLDFFERIRLINWIRATNPDPASLRRLDRNAPFLDDDQYLKPVIEDDPLLQLDFDTLVLSPSSAPDASSSSSSSAPAGLAPPVPSTSGPSSLDPSAQDVIDALRAQLSDAHQANDQLRRIVRSRLGGVMGLEDAAAAAAEEAAPVEGKGKGKETDEDQGEAVHKDDDHYYESYQYNDIHEIMLKDRVRTLAYRSFILHPSNAARFDGKVVLDVGCGTGILSMFAAQAGARKVYAVDASNVAFKAMRNVKANGFDRTIEVIKGKVEEIRLPEKVDVIISEWMGYCLLYECMLDSVLYARDKYLAPGGLMVPSQTSILLSAFAGKPWYADRVDFWDDVYGFKMEAMKDKIEDEAIIEVVDNGEVVSDEVSIADIYTQTATISSLSFTSPFVLPITRAPLSSPNEPHNITLHALLAHFDTFFTSAPRLLSPPQRDASVAGAEGEVFFTTGAWDTPTHWKQTMLVFKDPMTVSVGDRLEGTITVAKNPDNSRELSISATWAHFGPDGEKKGERVQGWVVR
ncbi:uncharacterized protein JCM10292_001696 [Rhodotorula paludigena]|uniref:uncharacterized protein n=1 Tax=Rhodotorula paludigena TaxID=86838 RepID=UPI0031755995